MEKFYVGYNDVCQAVGRATLNLISHGDAPTTEAIISMLESLGVLSRTIFDGRCPGLQLRKCEKGKQKKTRRGGRVGYYFLDDVGDQGNVIVSNTVFLNIFSKTVFVHT